MKKEKYIIIKQEEKMHFMHQQATNAGYIKRLCWCIVWCIKIGSKKGHLYCEITAPIPIHIFFRQKPTPSRGFTVQPLSQAPSDNALGTPSDFIASLDCYAAIHTLLYSNVIL